MPIIRPLRPLRLRTFAGLSGLRVLRLDGNALETLPDGLLSDLSLRLLRLDGNPGAPFALAVEAELTDAEHWAPPPATLRAAVPVGAPFDLSIDLAIEDGAFADGSEAANVRIGAGDTASASLSASSEAGFARVSASTPEFPSRQCMGGPCWRGFEFVPGEPLALFARPPRTLAAPEPKALFGGSLRLPLASLVEAGEDGELS